LKPELQNFTAERYLFLSNRTVYHKNMNLSIPVPGEVPGEECEKNVGWLGYLNSTPKCNKIKSSF